MKPTKQNTMEAIYLQSMTDFVLGQRMTTEEVNASSFYDIQTHIYKYYDKVFNYANFLKQPLQLGFLVPCFETGEIFNKPFGFDSYIKHRELSIKTFTTGEIERCKLYEKAKERVLFKGFKHYLFMQADNIKHNKSRKCFSFPNYNGVIIEDFISLEVELTESAIKQIGL